MKMRDFKEMEQQALKYQQFYYELLPDWFLYTSEEYDYIKERIGFALYGPTKCDTNEEPIANQISNSPRNWKYDEESCKMISNIYEKILEYGTQNKNSVRNYIYIGIIYNIAFNHNRSEGDSNDMYVLPIFKIKTDATTIWYIDSTGRIYKSWQDYIENNTLPKCLMVVPKDGVYQCNPNSTITKRYSTVWTCTIESPACGTMKTVFGAIDIASGVTGITVGTVIGVGSLLTPLAPIITATGLIAGIVTGGWTIGRSVEKLVDRATHEESINPLNALSPWLGITSSVLAIGTNGGSMLLSRAIADGSNISTAARFAFNSMVIGNLTANGCGIVYNGYRLIDQYQTHKTLDIFDVVMFSSQVLFFSNSLVNIKLANELIGTSNGTVLEKLKNALRFERLEQEYNRIFGGETNSEGIIHQLTRVSNVKSFFADHNMTLKFTAGKIVLNDMIFIDPFLVAEQLLKSGIISIAILGTKSLRNEKVAIKLKTVFAKLLADLTARQLSASNEQYDDSDQLARVFNEMANMKNSKKMLTIIFKISTRLLLDGGDPAKLLQDGVSFIWEYCKANLTQRAMDACSPLQENRVVYKLLTKIITNLGEFIDELIDDMYSAFFSYLSHRNAILYLH